MQRGFITPIVLLGIFLFTLTLSAEEVLLSFAREGVVRTAVNETISFPFEEASAEEVSEVVERALPSVVSIHIVKKMTTYEIAYENALAGDPDFDDLEIYVPVYRASGEAWRKAGGGTGFFVTANGHIITNRHVVSDLSARYFVILSDGTEKEARVVYRSPDVDLAVLKVDGAVYAYVTIDDSGAVRRGEQVVAIGNALGRFANSVASGVVSGTNRTVEALDYDGTSELLENVIQTNADILPGYSGGPLLSLDGEVIGVNVAIVPGSERISYAIPSNEVRKVLAEALNF